MKKFFLKKKKFYILVITTQLLISNYIYLNKYYSLMQTFENFHLSGRWSRLEDIGKEWNCILKYRILPLPHFFYTSKLESLTFPYSRLWKTEV